MLFRILLAALAVTTVSAFPAFLTEAQDSEASLGDGAAPFQTIPENLICDSYTGGKCGGLFNKKCSDDTLCHDGYCVCPPGTCANKDSAKCEAYGFTPDTPPRKDAKKIACPVLAALYNDGTLRPDEHGRVTLNHLRDALHNGAGADSVFSTFQATGVAAYKEDDPDEKSRVRCLTLSPCWWKRLLMASRSERPAELERYLNIFKMDLNPLVQHGYSTATRKDTHERSVGQYTECDSYPCEARFEEFWAGHADENGRIYKENIAKVICYAKDHGDFNGEFSFNKKRFLRQWQIKAALLGWLDMIGLQDENDERYIRVQDARTMFLEGTMPEGWQRRPWGAMKTVVAAVSWKLPCGDDAPPEVIENLPPVEEWEEIF